MPAVLAADQRSLIAPLRFLLCALCAICLAGLLPAGAAEAAGGTVMGWGYDDTGQVGNGTVSAAPCECVQSPVPVSGISDATQVSGSYYGALALRSDGTVLAWGDNRYGELGNGTTTESPVPAPVPVSGLSNVVQVAAGTYHGLALLANGTVMAWGSNEYGQLGQGSASGPEECSGVGCSRKPIPLPGLANVVAIAASYKYDMALLADGTVMFWGYDRYGESGNGTGTEGACPCVPRPVPVPGISHAVAISAGWYLTSALLADGTIRDWGYNFEGQIGNGTVNETGPLPCYCSGPVTVTGIAGARVTASGGYHGLALLGSGAVASWGENDYDQLGNGTTSETGCHCIPLQGPVSGLSAPRAISAGAYHSLALLPDGSVRSWGYGGRGELGVGSTANLSIPTVVPGVSGASAVNAADYTSFALIGPSQTLKVALAGAQAGSVGGNDLLCPVAACEAVYPQGQVEILRAEPGAGSAFAGFSGPCTGTGPCQVSMAQDQVVTATFGPPRGTKISKAKIRKKTAKFVFSAPGAITGYQCKLIRPHKKSSGKRGKASKRKSAPKWTGCKAPKAFKHLTPGVYTFKVRALDILGFDAKPAVKHFKIKALKH